MRRTTLPIRMPILGASLLAATFLSQPRDCAAQGRPAEFGIDGVVSVTRAEPRSGPRGPDAQTWAFPAQRVRVGLSPADRFQVQLSAGFSVADFGDISTVSLSVGFAGLYRVSGNGPRSGVFISLGTGLNLLSHNGTDVQWSAGGGIGKKFALGDRFAFRPALEVSRAFSSALRPAATTFSALIGFSAFTCPDAPCR